MWTVRRSAGTGIAGARNRTSFVRLDAADRVRPSIGRGEGAEGSSLWDDVLLAANPMPLFGASMISCPRRLPAEPPIWLIQSFQHAATWPQMERQRSQRLTWRRPDEAPPVELTEAFVGSASQGSGLTQAKADVVCSKKGKCASNRRNSACQYRRRLPPDASQSTRPPRGNIAHSSRGSV